ncbi:hypothetical protein, partial [Vibrio harveyi]
DEAAFIGYIKSHYKKKDHLQTSRKRLTSELKAEILIYMLANTPASKISQALKLNESSVSNFISRSGARKLFDVDDDFTKNFILGGIS